MPQFTEMRPPDLWSVHEAHRDAPPVVVGYDGSGSARRALDRAASLAGASGRVVVVAAAATTGAEVFADGVGEPTRAERDRWLREAGARLAGRDLRVSTWSAESEPAQALVEAAAASGARLIVVGARGDSFLARTLRGSVAERLVARAPCDVLVVR